MNFNPSTGFKRPHPGAEEEPHRAVRARTESALGQRGSTSGGGEPDAPLPAPGNLSAWEDSLPSFNFPPDVDWETPSASPTASVELSTILSELQGESAQGRDTASTEALPAGSMGAEELFAIQDQPVALQDATTSMSRQGSDTGRPAPAFAGDATGVDAAHQGRQSTQSMPGLHRNLLAARERLTAGVTFTAAVRELNIPHSTWANIFDRHGRLLINDHAKTLLQSRDVQVARQAQQLPRVLVQADLNRLTQALRDNAGREPRQLLAALQQSPNPVAPQTLEFLVDAGGLRADRLALLPNEQRQALEAAHQGRPLQNPLHRNLLAARQRLTAGVTPTAAARELDIPQSTLALTFDRHGHLLINSFGRTLLRSRDAQVARQARQLPRALAQVDLDKLIQALRDNAGREPWQLHTALQHSPNPITKEALAFLVDAGGLRADPLAQLPDEQRQALEAAHQGRQSTLQNPLHRNLLAARQRLAAGATHIAAAHEVNIPKSTLTSTFDRHGHLMINNSGNSLLRSRDAQVVRQAQQLPQALTQVDLNRLIQALRNNVGRESSQLHTALRNLPNPVSKEALEFLVDTGGLRADRLALLPDEQRLALEAANQGRQSPFQNPLHRNLLVARQRLAAGATATAAAHGLTISKVSLAHTFDRHGHLMINSYGKRLLQSRDAQVAQQARQLPRALVHTDLDRLTQALRDNAGREPSQLHTALRNLPNPVAKEALAFLVDAGGLRADRLALLSDEQRQALEAAHQGRQSPLQNPLHRNLLAAWQRLAAGATPTAAARELNIPLNTLSCIFNRRGYLMLNSHGRRLLQSRDVQVARQARQLPQALTQVDLNRLLQALRDNAGREPWQLHTALQHSPNPIAKEALAFLVDAGGLRADRLAQLPDEQRRELEAAWQAFCQWAPTS